MADAYHSGTLEYTHEVRLFHYTVHTRYTMSQEMLAHSYTLKIRRKLHDHVGRSALRGSRLIYQGTTDPYSTAVQYFLHFPL
jgi:hypothetical protein